MSEKFVPTIGHLIKQLELHHHSVSVSWSRKERSFNKKGWTIFSMSSYTRAEFNAVRNLMITQPDSYWVSNQKRYDDQYCLIGQIDEFCATVACRTSAHIKQFEERTKVFPKRDSVMMFDVSFTPDDTISDILQGKNTKFLVGSNKNVLSYSSKDFSKEDIDFIQMYSSLQQ